MNTLFAPLTEAEIEELEEFLLHDVDSDEAMVIDMLDGYLHAIAIGPAQLHPKQWLPQVWGMGTFMPPMESIEDLNYVLSLVMRHFNGIIFGLEAEPRTIRPIWSKFPFRDQQCEDAEAWAFGFVRGMQLCWSDWQPMLKTAEGQEWYRPIGLLGEDDYAPEQDALTKTPALRAELSTLIPDAILAMHAYWLPHRKAIYERENAKAMQAKVGRNDLCPCGSGKKFKKCCSLTGVLH
jgi:uncharacterized protein